ncbi:MAG: hypothetical protein MHPSP_004196, partial [Paramarteilia canceri]
GVSDSLAKITQSIGSNIANLTFDDDYQRKRHSTLQRQNSQTAAEIFKSSGENFVGSIAGGLKGLFYKPIQGAKKEGAEGFFKNLGKGVVGVVAKPVIGATDLVQGTFSAVSKGSKLTKTVYPVRHQRIFDKNGSFQPYNTFRSTGYYLTKKLNMFNDNDFPNLHPDYFLAYMPLPSLEHILFLTHSIFIVDKDAETVRTIYPVKTLIRELIFSTEEDVLIITTAQRTKMVKLFYFGSTQNFIKDINRIYFKTS